MKTAQACARIGTPACLALFTLLLPAALPAAEWSTEPSLQLTYGYNDNIRLTSGQHDAVWEAALLPALKFGVRQEDKGLTGTLGMALRRFFGGGGRDSGDALDREDYTLKSQYFYRTELSKLAVDLEYIQDSTLESELDQTGRVTSRATRRNFTLGPTWKTSLSERSLLELNYKYNETTYQDMPGSTQLVDYNYHTAAASLTYQINPLLQGRLSGGYARYQPDSGFDSNTLSLQAGLISQLSQTLSTSFLLGARGTTTDAAVDTGFCIGAAPGTFYPDCAAGGGIPFRIGSTRKIDATSPVYAMSIEKQLETGKLAASLSRSSTPSSQGELLDATSLNLSARRKLSATLSTSLTVNYTENETIVTSTGEVMSQGKDKYLRVTPELSWHWRREWKVSGLYRRTSTTNATGARASQSAVYVNLSYYPGKFAVSR